MNIQEVKDEVKKTIHAYLAKNEFEEYIVPRERQRPVFIVGAPGLGKTAIMKQIASELNIGLLSYTITHHTRQSAIGLPFITKKTYLNQEYSITEYTLSEIVASVYEAIENQGKREGILFIDEINAVSETLAPAMLELLQNKKFGPHLIPSGWILVSAGNPIEYNKSVKEFDAVTLDRVKKITVEPDFDVWKKYAYKLSIHPAIIYFLQVYPSKLFEMQTTPTGIDFCTPRSWEDLSVAMIMYAKLGFKTTLGLVEQYIQKSDTAKDFFRYLSLFEKYQNDYDVETILSGKASTKSAILKSAKFDERLSVIEVIVSALNQRSLVINENQQLVKMLPTLIKSLKPLNREQAKQFLDKFLNETKNKLEYQSTSDFDRRINQSLIKLIKTNPEVAELEENLKNMRKQSKNKTDFLLDGINHAFSFIVNTFGEGQELIALMINLLSSHHFVLFITMFPSPIFLKYNESLLIDKKNKQLLLEIEALGVQEVLD